MANLLSRMDNRIRQVLPDTGWINTFISQWDFYWAHHRLGGSAQRFNDYLYRVKTNPALSAYGFFVDKHLVKSLVAAIIGEHYIIPTLYVSPTGDGLERFHYADRYIVKPTHMSQLTIITQGALKPAQIQQAKSWLKASLFKYSREYQYRCLEPKIIIEPLIAWQGDVPPDLKFFMAGSRCLLIQVDTGRFGDHRRDFYSADWVRHEIRLRCPNSEEAVPPPAELPEMLSIAEKLGSMFEFSRIDLYLSDHGVKFGEITLSVGNANEPFPAEIDEALYRGIHAGVAAWPDEAARFTDRPSAQTPVM